jgi:hypothetical protein
MYQRAAISVSLAAVLAALILVGFVSGTPIRHVVQVVPIAVALVLSLRGFKAAPYAALAVFLFWLAIMVLIWLFLLGIARITTGHFTPIEIVLTVVIGGASAWGLLASLRAPSPIRVGQRIAWTLAFAVFQIVAMWVSLRPAIAEI